MRGIGPPAMVGGLRIRRAEGSRKHLASDEGWLGETDGINLTMSFLRGTRTRAQRLTARAYLGLPTHRRPESGEDAGK